MVSRVTGNFSRYPILLSFRRARLCLFCFGFLENIFAITFPFFSHRSGEYYTNYVPGSAGEKCVYFFFCGMKFLDDSRIEIQCEYRKGTNDIATFLVNLILYLWSGSVHYEFLVVKYIYPVRNNNAEFAEGVFNGAVLVLTYNNNFIKCLLLCVRKPLSRREVQQRWKPTYASKTLVVSIYLFGELSITRSKLRTTVSVRH